MYAMKSGTHNDNHFDKYGCHSMCPRFTPRSEQKAKELKIMRNYVKLILLDNIESYDIGYPPSPGSGGRKSIWHPTPYFASKVPV